MSIYRLELLGLLIGVRALNFVSRKLKKSSSEFGLSSKSHLWTDSNTVLHWLKSSVKQEIFVENRLKEIRSTKNLICHYVSTEENPADIGSRGCTVKELKTSNKWWHGPSWLSNPKLWPISNIPSFESNNNYQSKIKHIVLTSVVNESFIDFSRFSSFSKISRTIAWIFRFVDKIKNPKNKSTGHEYNNCLLPHELIIAERFLLIENQR